MPDLRGFLPPPPWERPPVPRRMTQRERRMQMTPADLYSLVVSSLIKCEQLIEEMSAESTMKRVIEFYGDKLEYDIERQIALLQAFLKKVRELRR